MDKTKEKLSISIFSGASFTHANFRPPAESQLNAKMF